MEKILSLARKCIQEYGMISANDRITVGVSGGKDSLITLFALVRLREFYPVPFELNAVTIDMGMPEMDLSPIKEFCESLNVEHSMIKTNLKEIIFDIRNEKNPCSLCAKMRRGILHDEAKKLFSNKVALGHHFDDAVETYMLSQVFEGRISCFMPVTYLDRKDITLIRPMLYIKEETISGVLERNGFPRVRNICPVNGKTKRQEIKELLVELNRRYPGYSKRIFGGMQRLPLPGWAVSR